MSGSSTTTSTDMSFATTTSTSFTSTSTALPDTTASYSIYPHTDNYFSGLSLMVQSVSITVFIVCAYLSVYVFKRKVFGIAYSLLALVGLLGEILLASYFLGKMDGVVNLYVIFSHWICLDVFNIGLTALKLQRLRIIQVGVTTKGNIIYYSNIASGVASFLGFTYNAMISFGPLSSTAVNPNKPRYILGVKDFSMRKIQHLEVILVGVALYTVGIIVIRYIQVTYSTSTDKLLAFATAQFPAALGLFLALQFLSILTSMENAKFAIMHNSKVGKTSGITSKGVTSKGAGITSGNGAAAAPDSAIIGTAAVSSHARNMSLKAGSASGKRSSNAKG